MPALLTRMSTPPQALTTSADGAVDLVLVGDVHRHRHRLAAAGLDLLGRGLGRAEVHVGDRDLGALAGVDAGDFLADAARGTGDDGDLVLKLLAHGESVLGDEVGVMVLATSWSVAAKSNTWTPCDGTSRPSQRGSSSVVWVSVIPAAQCSSIEVRENS